MLSNLKSGGTSPLTDLWASFRPFGGCNSGDQSSKHSNSCADFEGNDRFKLDKLSSRTSGQISTGSSRSFFTKSLKPQVTHSTNRSKEIENQLKTKAGPLMQINELLSHRIVGKETTHVQCPSKSVESKGMLNKKRSDIKAKNLKEPNIVQAGRLVRDSVDAKDLRTIRNPLQSPTNLSSRKTIEDLDCGIATTEHKIKLTRKTADTSCTLWKVPEVTLCDKIKSAAITMPTLLRSDSFRPEKLNFRKMKAKKESNDSLCSTTPTFYASSPFSKPFSQEVQNDKQASISNTCLQASGHENNLCGFESSASNIPLKETFSRYTHHEDGMSDSCTSNRDEFRLVDGKGYRKGKSSQYEKNRELIGRLRLHQVEKIEPGSTLGSSISARVFSKPTEKSSARRPSQHTHDYHKQDSNRYKKDETLTNRNRLTYLDSSSLVRLSKELQHLKQEHIESNHLRLLSAKTSRKKQHQYENCLESTKMSDVLHTPSPLKMTDVTRSSRLDSTKNFDCCATDTGVSFSDAGKARVRQEKYKPNQIQTTQNALNQYQSSQYQSHKRQLHKHQSNKNHLNQYPSPEYQSLQTHQSAHIISRLNTSSPNSPISSSKHDCMKSLPSPTDVVFNTIEGNDKLTASRRALTSLVLSENYVNNNANLSAIVSDDRGSRRTSRMSLQRSFDLEASISSTWKTRNSTDPYQKFLARAVGSLTCAKSVDRGLNHQYFTNENESPQEGVRIILEAHPQLKLTDFELCATVGTGTFGRVRMVKLRNCSDRTPLALKILKKSEVIRLKQVEHVKSEMDILKRIQHPFIVNLFTTFQDSKRLFMVMEFVHGGELFSYLRKEGRLDNSGGRFYASEITLALQYLHNLDIVYRDLKPENLLIDGKGHVKITDFGFSKVVRDRTWTVCGTPEYLAPEVIQSKGHGKSVDWWALGILIFEMLAGYPPFYDENPFGIYQKVLAGKINFPRYIDIRAKDLIKRLLSHDRTKRFGCLKGGAEDIKRHKWFKSLDWDQCIRRQILPPFIPYTKSSDDTSMFDQYPESTEGSAPTISPSDQELFLDF